MLTFIRQVFKNKKRDYLFLLIILTLLASFEFSFIAMYTSFAAFHLDFMSVAAVNAIPSLAVFVAVVLSTFIVNYFIANKKQEFSILLLVGRTPKDLFKYLIYQFGLLTLIAFLIGIGGGAIIMLLINYTLKTIQFTLLLNYNFLNTLFIYVFCLLITLLLILSISAKQFVSLDKELVRYLSQHSSNTKPPYTMMLSSVTKKKKIPIMSILLTILILYLSITNIINLMSPNLPLETLLSSFTWVLGGAIIIVNTTIPMLYDLLHDHLLLKHSLLMNALSSFNEFSQSMVTLINLNAVIVPFVLFILFFSTVTPLLQAVIIPCFIMIIIMIALCLLLRFTIYTEKRVPHIATLSAVGFSLKKLNGIALIKNSLFAILGFIVPLVILIQLFYKAYLESYLSQEIMIGLVIFYLVLYSSIFIYMVIKERHMQKEVSSNVKYLNRGQ